MELIATNPTNKVTLPKIKRYIVQYYKVEMLETLLHVTKETNIEAAKFLTVHYGFRRGEVLGLWWKDIDFN